jgi:hypothetical protein
MGHSHHPHGSYRSLHFQSPLKMEGLRTEARTCHTHCGAAASILWFHMRSRSPNRPFQGLAFLTLGEDRESEC